MATINKEWKRKVRISSVAGRNDGRFVDVVDVETGEHINNILSMIIRLDGFNVNTCDIRYLDMEAIAYQADEPQESTITVENVEIDDLTAFEIMDEIRKDLNDTRGIS
jgi:hypothetical protein